MEKVSEIKAELGGTERKLAEGLGHSREIGRLLGLVELVGYIALTSQYFQLFWLMLTNIENLRRAGSSSW